MEGVTAVSGESPVRRVQAKAKKIQSRTGEFGQDKHVLPIGVRFTGDVPEFQPHRTRLGTLSCDPRYGPPRPWAEALRDKLPSRQAAGR